MNELKSNYSGPTLDTPRHASSDRSLPPEALHELHKMRKTMCKMEKQLQILCILLLENQRLGQLEADYGNLFAPDFNHPRQRHQKSRVSLLDILR